MLRKLKYLIRKKIKKESFLWDLLVLLNKLLFYISHPLFIFRERGLLPFIPNKKYVEIEITSVCNLSCFNCNRSCGQAPSNECMSVEQIKRFVNESIKLNWRWENIRLIGGEPTLHPQLFEILKILKRYKDLNPKCGIELSTNGLGTKVNEVLSKLPDWVIVANSNKESGIPKFSSYNTAPIDLEKYKKGDFSKGCPIITICGLGLNRYGYYACGPGASVDRVFGFDIGEKKLQLMNNSVLKNQLKILCRYCGHFKDIYGAEKISGREISDSWEEAYEKYKKRRPKLDVY